MRISIQASLEDVCQLSMIGIWWKSLSKLGDGATHPRHEELRPLPVALDETERLGSLFSASLLIQILVQVERIRLVIESVAKLRAKSGIPSVQ